MSLPENPVLTIRDVCSYLGVSRATLRKWRKVGYGPEAVEIDGTLKYRPGDVEVWLVKLSDEEEG